jgi:hypothetical protein
MLVATIEYQLPHPQPINATALKAVVTLTGKPPGHVLTPEILVRCVVKYWIIGFSFCMIS